MSKLVERFEKIDKAVGKVDSLRIELEVFAAQNKDNEVLKHYIKLLKQIEKYEEEILQYKNLYEEMNDMELDCLDGKNCTVTLKKPYYKETFNTKQFKKDYAPDSKLYKKYITQQLVKGNTMFKKVEE